MKREKRKDDWNSPANEKTKAFALSVIVLYKKLQEQKEFVISNQLLRSGTSIWANLAEALAGQSKKDFFAKVCISLKESFESRYWLELLDESNLTTWIDFAPYLNKVDEVIRILASTKMTTKTNLEKERG